MEKFCPFMSVNPTMQSKSISACNSVPCTSDCALYLDGFCSFNVLAQKVFSSFSEENKNISK